MRGFADQAALTQDHRPTRLPQVSLSVAPRLGLHPHLAKDPSARPPPFAYSLVICTKNDPNSRFAPFNGLAP
eukprot:767519-Hanusia_phi.AAC.4